MWILYFYMGCHQCWEVSELICIIGSFFFVIWSAMLDLTFFTLCPKHWPLSLYLKHSYPWPMIDCFSLITFCDIQNVIFFSDLHRDSKPMSYRTLWLEIHADWSKLGQLFLQPRHREGQSVCFCLFGYFVYQECIQMLLTNYMEHRLLNKSILLVNVYSGILHWLSIFHYAFVSMY